MDNLEFKGVEENSKIKEIGSMFRPLNGSDWHINVKLAPRQRKKYFGISQLPVLARRRVINRTEDSPPAGFHSTVEIKNTRNWKSELINRCPIIAVSRQDDAQQWCFEFEFDGTTYYLPQLELARVLFFHHAYLARLSLIQSGLNQEFDVQKIIGMGEGLIKILPSCTLPRYAREDLALKRVLAWILLDSDARRSFESINRYQLLYGHDTKKYRLWRFQFDPPLLAGVKLTLRGHYDQELKAFFVYRVYGIANLTCRISDKVELFDPLYNEKRSGHIYPARPEDSPIHDVKIDDGQEPDSDKAEICIDSPVVTFSFANPFQVTRIGKSVGRSGGGKAIEENDHIPSSNETGLEVSTDESSTLGTLPSADYHGVEDVSNDAHLYVYKFEAFESMVEQLVNRHDCILFRREIRKFVSVAGCSKHQLVDGTPRCISFYFIKRDSSSYTLLEVDTSDGQNRLSTLLLKQIGALPEWNQKLAELEARLLKRSLVWPTSFLNQAFGGTYKRIKHPKTSSSNKILLDQDSIHHWADRVYSKMFMF